MSEEIILITADGSGKFAYTAVNSSILKTAEVPIEEFYEIHELIGIFIKELSMFTSKADAIRKYENLRNVKTLWDLIYCLEEFNKKLNEINEIGEILEEEHESVIREFERRSYFKTYKLLKQSVGGLGVQQFYGEKEKAISLLVDVAKDTLSKIKDYFIELHTAKLLVDIDAYINILKKIAVVQQRFETKWQKIYDRFIDESADGKIEPSTKDYISEQGLESQIPTVQKIPDTEKDPTLPFEEFEDLEELEEEEEPETEKSPITLRAPSIEFKEEPKKPKWEEWKINPETGKEEWKINPETGLMELKYAMLKLQHIKFVEELKKAAALDNPYLIAAMLSKYSGQIEDVDLKASLKLISIVEGILE